MLTLLAFCVSQVRVVACPLSTVLGLAVSDAVGADGAGGGGGGGGATFFLQAPSTMIAPRTTIKLNHFSFCCVTIASMHERAQTVPRAAKVRREWVNIPPLAGYKRNK